MAPLREELRADRRILGRCREEVEDLLGPDIEDPDRSRTVLLAALIHGYYTGIERAGGRTLLLLDRERGEALGRSLFDLSSRGGPVRAAVRSKEKGGYFVGGSAALYSKLNNAIVKRWLSTNRVNPTAEVDATGNAVSRYVYATRNSSPDYMIEGGLIYRLITDHLGSTRLVVSGDGTIDQRIDYGSFGRRIFDSNPGRHVFGFAGGHLDLQVGMLRFGTRDYLPVVGRWSAKDPIGFSGMLSNLYVYIANDPLAGVDRYGVAQLCSRPLAGGAGGLYGADAGALDDANREPEHQQFWWPDNRNIGYLKDPNVVGPDTKFGPEAYTCEGRIYDDDTLWQAAHNVGYPGPYSLVGDLPFGWLFGVGQNNCQDWVDEVLAEYERLRAEEARATGVDPEVEYVWNNLMSN